MSESQYVCFACGQHIRERAHRHEKPANPRVFVFAGIAVLLVIVGVIITNSHRGSRSAAAVQSEETGLPARHGARHGNGRGGPAAAVDEVNNLQGRFDAVRMQVVKGDPSPDQADLISQINGEIARLQELAASIAGQPEHPVDSLVAELHNGVRTVRSLITDLSHTSS